jgi:hypothetical protein
VDIPVLLSLLPLGVVLGLLGALLGVGGGFILVPILILAYGLSAHHAVGTSLAMVIATSISSTYAYSRQKRIDWRVGLVAASATSPTAILGAAATPLVSSAVLAIIFALVVVAVGVRLLAAPGRPLGRNPLTTPVRGSWRRRLVDAEGTGFDYAASWPLSVPALVAAGFAAGFLGIGGGTVVVPIFAFLMGLPIHVAIATSLVTMIPTSITGTISHFLLGNVQADYALLLVVSSLVGSQLGARISRRTAGRRLEQAFGALLILVATLLILEV